MSSQTDSQLSNHATSTSFHPLLSLLFISYLISEIFAVYLLRA